MHIYSRQPSLALSTYVQVPVAPGPRTLGAVPSHMTGRLESAHGTHAAEEQIRSDSSAAAVDVRGEGTGNTFDMPETTMKAQPRLPPPPGPAGHPTPPSPQSLPRTKDPSELVRSYSDCFDSCKSIARHISVYFSTHAMQNSKLS